MAHIRVVQTPKVDAIYINGTKVKEYGCVDMNDVIDVLRDNLGIDIKHVDFCNDDDDDEFGGTLPDVLRDFPEDTIDDDDRLGQPGILTS